MDLDSILHNLSQLGAQLDAVDDTITSANSSPMKGSFNKSGQLKKKQRLNVSFSDKPPVFYESEPPSDVDPAEHIYEGIDQYLDITVTPFTLANLLESRKSQLSAVERANLSRMDNELENVLRELHVLSEECEPCRLDEDDDDDNDEFPPPPPIPPPPVMSNVDDDDDDDDDDTLRYKTSSREFLDSYLSQTPCPQIPETRPLSYESTFSSDSITTTSSNTNTDSISNKSSDSHNDNPHSTRKRNLRHQPHSNSFSDSLPQVTAHPKNSNQMCIKIHSEDGSAKTIAVSRDTTVHQLGCILVKKYRHPISKAWSLVEQWSDICSERLLEGHLRIVDEIRKWPQDSDNQLWFANIPKKYDLFNDAQVSELLMDGSYVPSCEGTLYLKSLCKNNWKKFNFVLRSSGLYYSTKGKVNKSADLTCLSNLASVDIFTSLQGWSKEFKAPTRFGIALKPTGFSKLNIQNPLKYLCAEDAKTLQKWVDALRLAKYGRILYDDFMAPIVLPPPAIVPIHPHVTASWSNLIEDELDRVANNLRLQKSSVSLRDCSQLNISLDSSYNPGRRSDSIHSDEKIVPMSPTGMANAASQCGGKNISDYVTSPPGLRMPRAGFESSLEQTFPSHGISPHSPFPNHVHETHIGSTLKSSASLDKNLQARDDNFIRSSTILKSTPNEPVYDYITELPRDNPTHNNNSFNQFQLPAFRHNNISSTFHRTSNPLVNSLSHDALNGLMTRNDGMRQASNNSQFFRTPHQTPSLLQSSQTNGNEISYIDESPNKCFEFPLPPTPEIFQFLEQNKNDLLIQKQSHYEIPNSNHHRYHDHPHTTNGYYRQGSLQRSFIKGSALSDQDHHAHNSYTMEPTEFSLLKGMHHSFHSSDKAGLISPKRTFAFPPTPPRRSETRFKGHQTPDVSKLLQNIPQSGLFQQHQSSEHKYPDRCLSLHETPKHSNKMLEQNLPPGASGSTNNPRNLNGNDLNGLPPPPKEILENLKVQKGKHHIVSCNS